MNKRMVGATRWIAYAFLALLLALCGLSTEGIEEALADESWASSTGEATSIDGEACVSGQAIACVIAGGETRLAQQYDSVELLLEIDAQSSNCGPCDLVLVKSSSKTVERLVAELEASEGVIFAEPNYLEEPQSEDVDDSQEGNSEELHAEEAEQQGDNPEEPQEVSVESQEGDPEGLQEEPLTPQEDDPEEPQKVPDESQESGLEEPQAEKSVEPQDAVPLTAASGGATQRDYTDRQYAFNGEYGIGVPGWNTYDSAGNPTPSVSTAGKVVAVMDSGVDYNHEDLRNVMWDEGENYPALVALGGGAYGINVAMPRGDGTPYDTTDPMDDDGHGTHVAGIIAGEWNGYGISGAASGAKIMAVKVNSDVSMMSVHEAIRGYRYIIAAQKAGVDVVAINNSWNDDTYSKALDMAMREAGRLGAVSVFAAGNDRLDIDMIGQVYNAFFNNPYVVVVGNSNENGLASETSNYGRRAVDVFAPGEEIYSTILTGTGPADQAADPLVASGVTYACDYESTDVQNNEDNGVFGFKGSEGSTLAISDEGHASAHSLSLTGSLEEDMLAITLNSKELAAGSECHGLSMWVKAPAAKAISCMLICEFADGSSQTRNVVLTQEGDDWQALAFPIEGGANKDSLALSLTLQVFDWQGSPDPTILVDDVKLTSATIPYDYMTGTSMAAPVVTGGATILSAAFPDDDAAMRAARIVGSAMPVSDVVDLCVSDGIFRLDKALAQDTNPVLNGASTQMGTVTIEGYFFGDGPGSISVDGQTLTVTSWSDTEIVARLPSGFSPGEKLVQITTEAGKEGHQCFRIDTPPSLYRRLPLPGRALSGDPGDYTVTSSEFDESFYERIPHALVGLGGKLYYLLETTDRQCSIFCYDIDGQTWKQVYEGGYAPTGGACTWDGKILFIAGQLQENNTYLGLFDPDTNTAEYHLYNDQCYERRSTLVNTGKGILLAGGSEYKYGVTTEPDIDVLRTVNPQTCTVSTVPLPEDISLIDAWFASAYDEEGNGYLFCGIKLEGFYKLSFVDGNVTCTALAEGPIIDEGDSGVQHMLSASAEGSVSAHQNMRMAAGPTKSGIIASGPVVTDDSGVVTADTYTVDWGDTTFGATDKQMGVTKIYNIAGTTYRGQFYVIGACESEVGGWVFASAPVETLEQPGDVSDTLEPEQPDGPSEPKQPSKPSARQTHAKTRLPATGDPLSSSVPLLATLGVMCLIAANKTRKAR